MPPQPSATTAEKDPLAQGKLIECSDLKKKATGDEKFANQLVKEVHAVFSKQDVVFVGFDDTIPGCSMADIDKVRASFPAATLAYRSFAKIVVSVNIAINYNLEDMEEQTLIRLGLIAYSCRFVPLNDHKILDILVEARFDAPRIFTTIWPQLQSMLPPEELKLSQQLSTIMELESEPSRREQVKKLFFHVMLKPNPLFNIAHNFAILLRNDMAKTHPKVIAKMDKLYFKRITELDTTRLKQYHDQFGNEMTNQWPINQSFSRIKDYMQQYPDRQLIVLVQPYNIDKLKTRLRTNRLPLASPFNTTRLSLSGIRYKDVLYCPKMKFRYPHGIISDDNQTSVSFRQTVVDEFVDETQRILTVQNVAFVAGNHWDESCDEGLLTRFLEPQFNSEPHVYVGYEFGTTYTITGSDRHFILDNVGTPEYTLSFLARFYYQIFSSTIHNRVIELSYSIWAVARGINLYGLTKSWLSLGKEFGGKRVYNRMIQLIEKSNAAQRDDLQNYVKEIFLLITQDVQQLLKPLYRLILGLRQAGNIPPDYIKLMDDLFFSCLDDIPKDVDGYENKYVAEMSRLRESDWVQKTLAIQQKDPKAKFIFMVGGSHFRAFRKQLNASGVLQHITTDVMVSSALPVHPQHEEPEFLTLPGRKLLSVDDEDEISVEDDVSSNALRSGEDSSPFLPPQTSAAYRADSPISWFLSLPQAAIVGGMQLLSAPAITMTTQPALGSQSSQQSDSIAYGLLLLFGVALYLMINKALNSTRSTSQHKSLEEKEDPIKAQRLKHSLQAGKQQLFLTPPLKKGGESPQLSGGFYPDLGFYR